MIQAREYEVETGKEYLVQIDPTDNHLKLYRADRVDKPLEELNMKNFPHANAFVGDYGNDERFNKIKKAMSKLSKLQLDVSVGHLVKFKVSKNQAE